MARSTRVAVLLPVALILGALASALAPVAAWAGSATTPLSGPLPVISTPTVSTPAATLPATTTSTSSGGSFTGTDAIAVAAGAFALLVGISFFIWRDARRRAPRRGRAVTAAAGAAGRTGSKPRPKTRKPSPAERRRRKRGRARPR
jgi:hypothetical protein